MAPLLSHIFTILVLKLRKLQNSTANINKDGIRQFLPVWTLKVAFFSESEILFSNLQISKINYSKSLSWTWNLKFPPITVNNLFKFQAHRIVIWNIFFWDFEIWKMNRTFWKKATFNHYLALADNFEWIPLLL